MEHIQWESKQFKDARRVTTTHCYDIEAITQELAFGGCRRCEGPPDGCLFTDHILWAFCIRCKTVWWVMCSLDGWDKSEERFRQRVAELAGRDIIHNDPAFAKNLAKAGWDIGGGSLEAYHNGFSGESLFCAGYGLPYRKDDLSQPYRAPDGTPIHVRMTWSPMAELALRPDDAEQDDIHVLMAFNLSVMEAVVQGWWGGPPSQHRGRSQLKSMQIFPLKRVLRRPTDAVKTEQE